ncbi:MAG: hypothetical protein HZA19_02830 [Nitrospirae bacterium]|nr:hypothetical protein [Nitrospirota bacterium]
MEFLKILNFWVHLISAAVWIGGLLFISMVLLPTAKKSLSENLGGQFIRDLHIRFQKVAGILVFLLLVTGGVNIHFSHLLRGGTFSAGYFTILSVKIFLFGILLSIYLLNLKNLSQIGKNAQLERPPLHETSLVLGVLILLLAAFLKHTP